MTDRNVVIRLRGEIGDFAAKMAAAGRSVGGVVDKMTSGEKESKKFRDGLLSVGDAGGKIGLGAAAALGGIIAVTANFEQKMSGVRAATHESAEAMDQLREAAIQAGADTAFSASEAAEGIENLAKAGVDTADILGGGLQGALDLAAAGTVDVAFAAETAATAMTQFGLSGEQVPHIADLLAAAAGKAQGEVSDMAYALRQSGLVANQVGLSIEETTAGLAAFASQGLLGSDAGTSFKTMLSSLTPNSEKAAAAMESIGLAAYDANGNFIGLEEVARQLREGMRDLTDQQRQSTLETIFGSDAVRAASVLYDQGARGIREWTDAVDDQGYAAETAAIKLDNLKGDIEALKGSLETAFINMGSGSQDGLRGMTQSATDAVNAFNNLPDAMQGTVTQMLAITAITGGGLWFGSRVIRAVADTRDALDNLGISAGKTGSALTRGLAGAAVLGAISTLDTAIGNLLDHNLEDSNLGRSLDALAAGSVRGTVLNTFGSDLEGFGIQAELATTKLQGMQRLVADIPLLGSYFGGFSGDAAADAVENIEMLDEALARLVESGDQQNAEAIFRQLMEAARGAGADVAAAGDLFDQYALAVENAGGESYIAETGLRAAGKAIEDTERVTGTAARGIEGVGDASADAAVAAEELEAALGDLEVILNGRQKNRAYEESLDAVTERLKDRRDLVRELEEAEAELASPDRSAVADAQKDVAEARRDIANADTPSERESAQDRLATALERVADAEARVGESAADARERIRDLKEQLADYALTTDDGVEAGRAWNQMFEDIAKNAAETALTLDEADRPDYLNQARRNFIDLAAKIVGSREKAKALADELGLIHRKPVKVTPEVDTRPAREDVRKFYRWLEGLPPARVKMFVDNLLDTQEGKLTNGGRTPRQFASGGYTGAMPVDAIAGVVHGREFVHDAQTTAMFRPLFEYIHQHRRLPGYQSGGYVKQISSPTSNHYYGASGPMAINGSLSIPGLDQALRAIVRGELAAEGQRAAGWATRRMMGEAMGGADFT